MFVTDSSLQRVLDLGEQIVNKTAHLVTMGSAADHDVSVTLISYVTRG